MPYIKQEDRDKLDPTIDKLIELIEDNHRPGWINYTINRLLLGLERDGSYNDLNELVGAIECAKLEYYRRRLGPKEDKSIEENGDLKGFPQ